MKKLFGTDGIRGLAGEFPLDDKTVAVIGASLAREFRRQVGRNPRFLSGRDTRESGASIESALHAGACSEGAASESAGVITTPGNASYGGMVNDGSIVRLGLCAFNVSIAAFIGMPSLTPTTSMNPAFAAIFAVTSGVPKSTDA